MYSDLAYQDEQCRRMNVSNSPLAFHSVGVVRETEFGPCHAGGRTLASRFRLCARTPRSLGSFTDIGGRGFVAKQRLRFQSFKRCMPLVVTPGPRRCRVARLQRQRCWKRPS